MRRLLNIIVWLLCAFVWVSKGFIRPQGCLRLESRATCLFSKKRPSSGAAAAGKGFEEREGNNGKTKSKRDHEIESMQAEMLSKLGLEDYDDDVPTGAELRKHRKDASKVQRKKETKKMKLAEKKRAREEEEVLSNRDSVGNGGRDYDFADGVVTANTVWEVLCERVPYLLPEYMDQLLVIEDSEEEEDGGGREDIRGQTNEVVKGALKEPNGYLKILRYFATSGKGDLFNDSQSDAYDNGNFFFLFMLAAYLVLVDSHYSSMDASLVDVMVIFDQYFSKAAWTITESEETQQERLQNLLKALRTWEHTIEIADSTIGVGGVTDSGLGKLSARYVVIAPQQSSSGDAGEKGSTVSISMNDAASVGLLAAACESIGSDGGDTGACSEAVQAELSRQEEVFTRMQASMRRNVDSGPTAAAFLKVAVILAASTECAGANAGAGDLGEDARAVCDAVGVHTTTPLMLVKGKRERKNDTKMGEGSIAAILRECAGLKRSADFRLPVSPFYDSFARGLRTHPALSDEDRVQIASALIQMLATLGSSSANEKGDNAGDMDRLGACRFLAGLNSVGTPLEQLIGANKGFDKGTKQAWGRLTEKEIDGGMLNRALSMRGQEFAQQVALRVQYEL